MKTIGLIGGMSWESSIEYYRVINERVATELGGLHSASCVLVSVDFAEIEELQAAGDWARAAGVIGDAALRCERGGADFIVLCTNTMHKVVADAATHVRIPFLHIADATARRIRAARLQQVALLGTMYTMEETFYRGRLEDVHGLDVLVPSPGDREIVHRIIYDELVVGRIEERSRRELVRIIEELGGQGAEGVIAGCTEIGLLVGAADSPLPLFDTARIHASEAVAVSLERGEWESILMRP